ncbi:MAG TPA: type II toxin-antitoxin system death-on-curing family toxin [Acidobacteriaceae bacterium]
MSPRARRWQWVEINALYAIHDRLIAEHGGLGGTRDRAMIESAMARPQHLAIYGKPDAADLASAYAFGLARNHGFMDGNKRAAWTVARLFLARNGLQLNFQAIDAIVAVERLAAGVISQDQFAEWLRTRLNA